MRRLWAIFLGAFATVGSSYILAVDWIDYGHADPVVRGDVVTLAVVVAFLLVMLAWRES